MGAPAQPTSAFGSFGAAPAAQGGIFGAQKPLTGFGVPAQPATSTAFGFAQNPGTSLFNNTMNKPVAPVFSGFGQSQPAAPLGGTLGFGQNSTSLFGNNTAKPGGMFGSTTPSTGGMFGSTQPFGASNSLNLGGGAFGQ